MTRPVLDLDELAFDTQTHGERFEARMAPVASRIGAAKLGYRVTQLPPGKRAWPTASTPSALATSSPRPPAAWRPRTRSSTTATSR